MANRKFLPGILVIALVFGMTVIGCEDGSTEDEWSDVTSASQLHGTWKISSPLSYSYTLKEMFGENWNSELESRYGNLKVTVSYSSNYTITFNSYSKTMSFSGSGTQTYSDGNINTIWAELKEEYMTGNQVEGITVSANDANHSITITYNNLTSDEGFDEEASGVFQINQDGSKLKSVWQIPGIINIEVIFIKQ